MPLGKEAWRHDPQIMRMERHRQEIENMPEGEAKVKAKKQWDKTLKLNLMACGLALIIALGFFIGCIVMAIISFIKA